MNLKTKTKKYPLLISLIISCVIVITAIVILAIFGMRMDTSLGSGSQFEITMSNDASSTNYVNTVKDVAGDYGLSVDTTFVEDKYVAGEDNTDLTTRCLVVKLSNTNISDETKTNFTRDLVSALGTSESNISSIYEITGSVRSNDILFLGLAVGIVAVCLFVFAWIRYNIFAGLSFLLAYLHNIILYLSILILTRVQLSLVALSIGLILTLVMGAVLVAIYEKYREKIKLHLEDKQTVSERMIQSEKETVKPFAFIFGAILVFIIIMFFSPVANVKLASINILIALVVTLYTSLLIGPASYSALLEIRDMNAKAVLSRNHEVNKEIKKKIEKSKQKKEKKVNKENTAK